MFNAVKQNRYRLKYAAPELKADREFMFEAVEKIENSLGFAAHEHKAKRQVALDAVERIENSPEHAAPLLKADRVFVLEAVKRNGRSRDHAAEDYANCLKLVRAALKDVTAKSSDLYRTCGMYLGSGSRNIWSSTLLIT